MYGVMYFYFFLNQKKKTYVYIYIDIRTMSPQNHEEYSKGFGHLKDEVFFAIKTSKHVGFGGPKIYIIHQVKQWPHEHGEMAWVTLGWDFFQLQAYSETELNQFGLSGRLSDVVFQEEKTPYFVWGWSNTHFDVCCLFDVFYWCFFTCSIFVRWKVKVRSRIKVIPCAKKNLVLTGHAGEGSHIQCIHPMLGGGFKYFLFSPRTLGKMNPFWLITNFSNGLVRPPTSNGMRRRSEGLCHLLLGLLRCRSLKFRSSTSPYGDEDGTQGGAPY